MNEIINWVAINNTLLIKIGFTAILVLVVIYLYRFFFVIKINTVAAAEVAQQSVAVDSGTESKVAEKNKVEDKKSEVVADTKVAPVADIAVVKAKDAEIEKLKSEVEQLKTKVVEAETQVTTLKAMKTVEQGSGVDATPALDAVGRVEAGSAGSDQNDLVASLNAKIDQLQARLTEYEIIAEDISEIGQLREENEVLRKRQGLDAQAPVKEQPVETIAEEALVQAAAVSPSETEVVADSLVASSTESTSSVRLTSEKEVSPTEQQLINEFEEISNKKGS
jgi:hypothetical protein